MQSTPVVCAEVCATYWRRTFSSLLGRRWVAYSIVHHQSPITRGVEATSLPGRPPARIPLIPTESVTTTVTVQAEFEDGQAAAAPNAVGRRWPPI
jgi:hypothetical protein